MSDERDRRLRCNQRFSQRFCYVASNQQREEHSRHQLSRVAIILLGPVVGAIKWGGTEEQPITNSDLIEYEELDSVLRKTKNTNAASDCISSELLAPTH